MGPPLPSSPVGFRRTVSGSQRLHLLSTSCHVCRGCRGSSLQVRQYGGLARVRGSSRACRGVSRWKLRCLILLHISTVDAGPGGSRGSAWSLFLRCRQLDRRDGYIRAFIRIHGVCLAIWADCDRARPARVACSVAVRARRPWWATASRARRRRRRLDPIEADRQQRRPGMHGGYSLFKSWMAEERRKLRHVFGTATRRRPDGAGRSRTEQRSTPDRVDAGQGFFMLVWRVKDSNLGRHQPTDLQSAPIGRSGNPPGAGCAGRGPTIHRVTST